MGRKRKPAEEVLVDVPLKLLPDVAAEVETIASRLERSKSFFSRKMFMRGLAAYKRDGLLDEQDAKVDVFPLPQQPTLVADETVWMSDPNPEKTKRSTKLQREINEDIARARAHARELIKKREGKK